MLKNFFSATELYPANRHSTVVQCLVNMIYVSLQPEIIARLHESAESPRNLIAIRRAPIRIYTLDLSTPDKT